MEQPHTIREAWLQEATEKMRPWFTRPLPVIRVSCAWAKRAGKNKVGWCWHREASKDTVNEIQISPELDDPVKVLAVLLHELNHASDNGESGHKGNFRVTALALGFCGKMTTSTPGPALTERLKELAAQLGPYPHAALNPATASRVGKQSTRMIKIVCPEDGYTLRTTRKWLDQLGLPTCPCETPMEEAA